MPDPAPNGFVLKLSRQSHKKATLQHKQADKFNRTSGRRLIKVNKNDEAESLFLISDRKRQAKKATRDRKSEKESVGE